MESSRIFLISLVDTSSPSELSMDSEKKVLIKKVPKGVCTYLLLATRLTVEMSMPTWSAMSLRIMGFKCRSSPVRKYFSWYFMMADMVSRSVCWRCLMASMNHLAASIFCFTKRSASLLAADALPLLSL